MNALLAGLMASKGAKVGATVAAGGGSLMLVLNLLATRIDDLEAKVDLRVGAIQQYVDYKHNAVMLEIRHLSETQSEMKGILQTIERRMYDERKINQ